MTPIFGGWVVFFNHFFYLSFIFYQLRCLHDLFSFYFSHFLSSILLYFLIFFSIFLFFWNSLSFIFLYFYSPHFFIYLPVTAFLIDRFTKKKRKSIACITDFTITFLCHFVLMLLSGIKNNIKVWRRCQNVFVRWDMSNWVIPRMVWYPFELMNSKN